MGRGTCLQSEPEGDGGRWLHSKFEASLGYKGLSKEIRKKGRRGEEREERRGKKVINEQSKHANEMGKKQKGMFYKINGIRTI